MRLLLPLKTLPGVFHLEKKSTRIVISQLYLKKKLSEKTTNFSKKNLVNEVQLLKNTEKAKSCCDFRT